MNSREATAAVIDALGTAGIPYILVGSLASNVYGVARSTQGADFVLSLGGIPIASLMTRLGPRFHLDPQMSFESVTGTSRYIVHIPEIPFTIELFLLGDDPHDQSRFRRRTCQRTDEGEVFLPSPEDVVVTKLRWALAAGRSKDEMDVRNVLAVQSDALDWDYIHGWCDQHGTRDLLDRLRRSIPPI